MPALRRLRYAVVAGVILLATLLPATPVRAATITVTTTADGFVADSQCGLREAIQAADTNAPAFGCPAGSATDEEDLITLPAGEYRLTATGPGEDANLTGDLDVLTRSLIRGAGAGSTVIDGQDSDRIFDAFQVLRLENLTLRNGKADEGGAVRAKDGLLLIGVRLVSNTATGAGGAVALHAPLNWSVYLGILDSFFSENDAASGGAIYVSDDSSVESVSAMDIWSTTIAGNVAVDGDGVYVGSYVQATINDSTIARNGGLDGRGGGIFVADRGRASLSHVTLAGNWASSTPGSGGNIYSVIGDNVFGPGDTIFAHPGTGGNCNLPIRTRRSLEWVPGGTAYPCLDSADSSNVLGDPKLPRDSTGAIAAPSDNGGPTPTLALGVGSAALDAAYTDIYTEPDQRGVPRPFGRAADIGAYERSTCRGVLVNRVGTAENDVLTGSAGADGILGLGGNDSLRGLGSIDGLCGGSGNDLLEGGGGADRLDGGTGSDTGSWAAAAGRVTVDLRRTPGRASGQGLDQTWSLENVIGSRFADVVYGNGFANWFRLGAGGDLAYGFGAADRLDGGSGNDRLYGGSGNDALYGEAGNDYLSGGSGRDRCRQGTGWGIRVSCELR